MKKNNWHIKLANPRGFCAGVDRAISIVEHALNSFALPIYVHHEVVHNKSIVDDFIKRGIIFVESLADVPENSILIFSAHGVAKSVRQAAATKKLQIFDATCPLVTKVHITVHSYNKQGWDCVLIGHKGHPEVVGTMGQFLTQYGGKIYLVENITDVQKLQISQVDKLFCVSQTTLSLDDTAAMVNQLKIKYPRIKFSAKSDICYATQNRQTAVKEMIAGIDILLVIGSVTSSNSNRLRELAQRLGKRAFLIDDPTQIQQSWLQNVHTIGVTAGASAPEQLVQKIVKYLGSLGSTRITEIPGQAENITFKVPLIPSRAKSIATSK